MEASSAPLGGSLGASGSPPGACWDPGSPWTAPGALGPLLAAGRPLGRSGRLPGGSWSPLGGSKVAFCRKAEFRRQYSVFHSFLGVREPPGTRGALLEPSLRPLRPSWRLLGRPTWSWVALGRLLAGLSGSWVVLGWPGPGPWGLGASPPVRRPRTCLLYTSPSPRDS